MSLDLKKIKKDFPILERKINGNDLVYLDNAATSQKPQQVIDAISDYYSNHNANVHRGIHTLSEEATQLYEGARKKVAEFIGAAHSEEVIFTKGTTESINRVAFEWGIENVKKGDVILTTNFEHHSNLVPWQIVAQRTGAILDYINVGIDEDFPLAEFKKKLAGKVKLIAISHASNVLGTILPVKEICKIAHEVGALVSVDGAQAVPHMKVNVQSLGCDFYSFSAHKMLGPMGIGVLWAKKEILEKLEPYEYGGGMIESVDLDKSTWAKIPERFEAGTPNVEGAVGLASAIDYLQKVGIENIREHEIELNKYTLEKLGKIKEVIVIGPKDPNGRTGLVSFTVKGIHSHDVAAVLNGMGVAVRSGHHCAMPLHKSLGITSTTRASYYLYNSKEDIDKLIDGVKKAIEMLG